MFDKDVIMLQVWTKNQSYDDIKICACKLISFDHLQIAASKMDPNHFLMLILLRFELFDIFNGNCSSKDQVSYLKINNTVDKKR